MVLPPLPPPLPPSPPLRRSFDPVGFSQDAPSLFRRRAVELKHGRVAMLATVGVVVQTFVHLPGEAFGSVRPYEALTQVGGRRTARLPTTVEVIGAHR
jgi:Chlorophyll A-B binding protein